MSKIMDKTETNKGRETPIKKMMEACDKDPNLQKQLFENPDVVAKKFEVTLTPEEKAQIGKVASLYRLVDEFQVARFHGPGPIFYPVDVWWRRRIFNHVLSYRPIFNPLFYPIGYPIDILRIGMLRQLEETRIQQR
jgi:hypothetical protein